MLSNMASSATPRSEHRCLAHLSEIDPEWALVAASQRERDAISKRLFALPVDEFRAMKYWPPPLPEDAPVPGRDINISQDEIPAQDGTKIGIRIYKPINSPRHALLFFNAHGGGSTSL